METGKKIAAGVLPVCTTTGRMLIVQRGLHQPSPGLWACFGGKWEEKLDKSPKDTAKREFVEESKYAGRFKISKTPLHINESNHSVFYTYIGVFDEEFTPDIENSGEAMDYGWFYLDEIPGDLLPGFKKTLEEKKKTIQNIICFYSGKC